MRFAPLALLLTACTAGGALPPPPGTRYVPSPVVAAAAEGGGDVRVIPRVRSGAIVSGVEPELRAIVENHGDEPIAAGSDVEAGAGIRILGVAWHWGRSAGHRPARTDPPSVIVPPREGRELRLVDPDFDESESFATWVPGHRELSIDYLPPTSARVASASPAVAWEVVGDGAPTDCAGGGPSVAALEAPAVAVAGEPIALTVSLTNGSCTTTWVAGWVRIHGLEEGETVSWLRLGGPPRAVGPGEEVVLGTGTVVVPSTASGALSIEAEVTQFRAAGVRTASRTIEITNAP